MAKKPKMPEIELGQIEDFKPENHAPDAFEQRFGVIGGVYMSPEGKRRVKDDSLIDDGRSSLESSLTRSTPSKTDRIMNYIASAGWVTRLQVVKAVSMQHQAGSKEIEQLYKQGALHRADVGKSHYYFLPGTPFPESLIRRRKYGDDATDK